MTNEIQNRWYNCGSVYLGDRQTKCKELQAQYIKEQIIQNHMEVVKYTNQ